MPPVDTFTMLLLSLLTIILVFLSYVTYLNVIESKRGKSMEDMLCKLSDSLDKLSNKLPE